MKGIKDNNISDKQVNELPKKVECAALCMLLFCSLLSSNFICAQNFPTREDNVLSVGAAHASITPSLKVRNWITGESYLTISDSIYARTLVLDDGHEKVIILSWEIVDAGNSAVEAVKKKISEIFKIPQKNILVNASHNHSAPWSPVYSKEGGKGNERYPWWVTRYMPAQDGEMEFEKWKELLIAQSIKAVKDAIDKLQPVSMWIGRFDISRFIRNRRPRLDSTGLIESGWLGGFNYSHVLWDPRVLSGEFSFGPMDRTMTVVSFKNEENKNVSTLFNFGCHAISVYPYDVNTISGDWPGKATRIINEELGGDNLFLQGAAGDINPSWLSNKNVAEEFPKELAKDIKTTYKFSSQFSSTPMIVEVDDVDFLLTASAQRRFGMKSLKVLVQVVSIGNLAIVALPGEPMTEIGRYIIDNSPFPQTIVVGYANGYNQYYGMPHEEKYGGYETRSKVGIGEAKSGLDIARKTVNLIKRVHKSYINRMSN